jgi:FkbM family methyltransferase
MSLPIISHVANIIDNTPKDRPFVLLEIGACDGFHSQIFASILRIYSKSFIMHSFEPVGDLISAWKNWTIHHTEHIKIFNKAVGIVDGQIPFYVSYGADFYGSSSIRKPTTHLLDSFTDMKFKQSTAESVRLDTHCKQTGIESNIIDFIWMDVQGAERDVFEGGKQTLERTRYIYTEYSDNECYEGEYNLQSLLAQLGDDWMIVQDYGGDVLLKNKNFPVN